ncbi:pilus assembly protein [Rhizobiaceae bacterium n13]|uniref:Pilus assembly protein n=1 Tax=Ferirhizobium litorale TaxID=2927786 RepID=A0AAE3QIW9_9HYPH|nr:TadE/TadG family type IV pilus assembly protein [Fererhizobium litorale]MDI7862824.1 pilus assembly protein [Fererhizobium litorale]MDI7923928.1 pilus assembly protein [Fererhizobium litorale]
MRQDLAEKSAGQPGAAAETGALRRFYQSRDGTAMIEFSLLAIPYCMILFAILETCIAFFGDQLVSHAVDSMARKMRTGEITTTITKRDFRQQFCDEISILIACSTTEVDAPDKLFVDVRSFPSFADVPKTIPRISTDRYADIKTSEFKFAPGGPNTINMIRAYYRWHIITDLVRPYISTIRPADGSMSTFLIVQTAAFQNENY